jgi:hypothetical protein
MLFRFDEDIARQTARHACQCGGVLNIANFHRAPRGMPSDASDELRSMGSLRFSFCCTTCRRRTTPPSLRFHGRSWYYAPVRLLASVMDRGCRRAARTLGLQAGISSRTLSRWRRWWNQTFRVSRHWTVLRGFLRPDAHDDHLPDSVLVNSATEPRVPGRSGPDLRLSLGILAPFLDFRTRFPNGVSLPLNMRRV